MEFVRSSIVKYLNDGMANSKYAKTIREMGDKTTWASKELEALKTMTYDDFDFIERLNERTATSVNIRTTDRQIKVVSIVFRGILLIKSITL